MGFDLPNRRFGRKSDLNVARSQIALPFLSEITHFIRMVNFRVGLYRAARAGAVALGGALD
jgi:hypothetical protein